MVLPKANRVTRPADFRMAVRHGRRVGGATVVLYVLQREEGGPSRFGFVVARSVGNAVTRNLVRRRLRAAGAEVLPDVRGGMDILVRALPASGAAPWATLHTEMIEGVRMEMARA